MTVVQFLLSVIFTSFSTSGLQAPQSFWLKIRDFDKKIDLLIWPWNDHQNLIFSQHFECSSFGPFPTSGQFFRNKNLERRWCMFSQVPKTSLSITHNQKNDSRFWLNISAPQNFWNWLNTRVYSRIQIDKIYRTRISVFGKFKKNFQAYFQKNPFFMNFWNYDFWSKMAF